MTSRIKATAIKKRITPAIEAWVPAQILPNGEKHEIKQEKDSSYLFRSDAVAIARRLISSS